MAKGKQVPLLMVIKAVNNATKPLRELNQQIERTLRPFRAVGKRMSVFSEELGIPKANKALKEFRSSAKNVGKEAGDLFKKVSVAAIGAAVGAVALVKAVEGAGSRLADLSARAGISVDQFAQLEFAAKRSGIENEQFASSLDGLNKQWAQAKSGGGKLLGFLQKVSPALAKQFVGTKDAGEAMLLLAGAFEQVTDPAKRAALSTAAFGNTAMGLMLAQGRAGIAALGSEYLRLAGSQQALADASGAMGDALDNAEVAFLGLRNAAAGALFPALTEIARTLTDFMANNRDGLRAWAEETGQALMAWVQSGGIDRLIAGVKDFAASVKSLAESLGGLKGLAAITGAVMSSSLVSAVVGLVKSLWGLGAAVAPLIAKFGAFLLPILAKLGAAVLPILAKAGAAVASVMGTVGAAIASVAATAGSIIAAVLSVAAAGYAIYKGWEPLKELFSDLGQTWEAFKELFSSPLESLRTAKDWWAKELFGIQPEGRGSSETRTVDTSPAALGARAAAEIMANRTKAETHVTVDFNNMPPGTRVTQGPTSGPAQTDLNLGYSMVTP